MKLRLLLLAAFLLASTGASNAATFRWANDGDVGALDPYTRDETFQISFLSSIYEPLIRRDAELKLQPALATGWQQTSPTTWLFHLRPGVRWQDGTKFTADDVLFSFTRVKQPSSFLRVQLTAAKSIRKLDDLTVEIVTAKPDPIFPQEITGWLIMSKAWCEAHDATVPVLLASGKENYAVRHAMGTGPFRVVSREPDRRTVLEANPKWWDTRQGNVDRVEFDVISNAATRLAALLSGEIDMIYAVPTQDIPRLQHAPGLKVIERPELRTIFLGMDQSRPELLKSSVKGKNPFKDRRVREAFALAIDEGAIARSVMRGEARPTWLMWGPGVNGFNAKLNARPKPDPAHARQLLAEAGYPHGFELGMDCPNDRYVNDAAICTAVVAMLARVGVKVDLAAQTKAKYFAEISRPTYHTSFYMLGWMLGWTPATYDALNVLQNLIHTRQGGLGLVNDGDYSNPQVDALIGRIAVETDLEKRDAMIDQAARLVQQDVGYIPLHQQTIVWAARDNVHLVQRADDYFPLRLVRVGP